MKIGVSRIRQSPYGFSMKAIIAVLVLLSSVVGFCQEDEQFRATDRMSKFVCVTAFPDTTKATSPLVLRMVELDKISQTKDQTLYTSANKPLLLSIIASDELGITPKITALDADQLRFFEETLPEAKEAKKNLNKNPAGISPEILRLNEAARTGKPINDSGEPPISKSERARMEQAVWQSGLARSLYIARQMPDDQLTQLFPQALQIIELRNLRR